MLAVLGFVTILLVLALTMSKKVLYSCSSDFLFPPSPASSQHSSMPPMSSSKPHRLLPKSRNCLC